MTHRDHQIWDLWYPDAAAQGMPFARGRLAATDVLLVHAAPDTLDVVVRSDDGEVLAQGKGLARTAERPMARLTADGAADCHRRTNRARRPVAGG
ncbi:MAG: hypothetical protein K0R44_540 [Thermomicrobiales bacterium]|nr:hypothetical protein [Thermomicrobiales bacterium]